MGFLYLGGIIGNDSSEGITQNCYNTKKVKGSAKTLRIGGIIGDNLGKIENCYNVGNVEGTGIEELRIGMIIGRKNNTASFINSAYYLKNNSNITGIGASTDLENMAKTEKEMKESNFINLLNKTNNSWKKDMNNLNNGYPILNWQ